MYGGEIEVTLGNEFAKSSTDSEGDGVLGVKVGEEFFVDLLLKGAFRLSWMELVVDLDVGFMVTHDMVERRGLDVKIAKLGHRKRILKPVVELGDLRGEVSRAKSQPDH